MFIICCSEVYQIVCSTLVHHIDIFSLKSRPGQNPITADPGPGHNLVIPAPAPAKNLIPVGYCNQVYCWQELLKEDSTWSVPIEKDLHRTYKMHELFAERGGMGQTELFKVLHAYSVYNSKVGYCQVTD